MDTIRLKTIDDRILDMDELGHAIVAAEGNLALVAERLLGHADHEAKLLEAISANPAALNGFSAKARAFTIIKMLSLFSVLHMNVLEGAAGLEPDKAANIFVKMADALSKLSAFPTNGSGADDTMDSLLRKLPPRLAGPLRAALSEGGEPMQQIIDVTPGAIYKESADERPDQ